jgi:stress-induced morphogen
VFSDNPGTIVVEFMFQRSALFRIVQQSQRLAPNILANLNVPTTSRPRRLMSTLTPSSSSAIKPVEDTIRRRLQESFASHGEFHLEIANESHKHNVPKGTSVTTHHPSSHRFCNSFTTDPHPPPLSLLQYPLHTPFPPVWTSLYTGHIPGSESHFNVLIVSDAFEGKKLIERHRLVNTVLSEELKGTVHALSIQARTVQQWSADPAMSGTPNCMGGSKH